jgi:hypothetical protein
MSDIQFALTILAVIIILIMIIFNWIRLIQYRKQNHTENSFLYKNENGLSQAEKNSYDQDLSISEKYLLSNLPKDIHRDIDAIAFIKLNKATQAISKLNLRDLIELPHTHIYIRKNEDNWTSTEGLSGSVSFDQILLAIQLVDRQGPISSAHTQTFRMLVEKTKNDLDGSLIWLSHSNIEDDAKELNQFCALVDHMMTLTLIPKNNGMFDNEKLIDKLKADNFKENKDGYHVFKGRDKHPLFRITSLNQQPLSFNLEPYIQGILFQMDLPLTLSCKESFDVMLESITNFQKDLDCILVDSNKKELNIHHIERIRYQVEKIENQMISRNISPGSSCARRLFS